MSKTIMMTLPREHESIEEVYLLQWMLDNDIHKWIIAKETGIKGYKHWQVRFNTNATFEELKKAFPKGHIEEASNDYRYEKKEGNYYTSEDTIDVLRTRFGVLRIHQHRILDRVMDTNDREICTIIDTRGCTGKSFLAKFLYEKGYGFYVPPTISTPQGIIQFIASGYRGEEIIVIDIPRSTKWNNSLYVCIETIKDGLIYDSRYSTTIRNIFGVKVLIFCNTAPNVDKLSKDRWKTYDAEGYPVKVCSRRKKTADSSRPNRNTKDGSIPLGIEG